MDIKTFIDRHSITITNVGAPSNPHMEDGRGDGKPWEADHWLCTLRCGERTMKLYYSKGAGHRIKGGRVLNKYRDGMVDRLVPAPPTVAEVLECLQSDCAGLESSRDFEDWAGDLGYSADSRKAEKIYRVTQEQARKLETLLGRQDYRVLLDEVTED